MAIRKLFDFDKASLWPNISTENVYMFIGRASGTTVAASIPRSPGSICKIFKLEIISRGVSDKHCPLFSLFAGEAKSRTNDKILFLADQTLFEGFPGCVG